MCDGGQKLDGWIRHATSEILIDADLDPQMVPVILWHEVVHAILRQTGYHEHDERMIEILGHGIAEALKRNKGLREP